MDGMKERIASEARACMRITNNMLVCKDCIYKLDDSTIFGNTSRCRVYPESLGKPDAVLTGGNCQYYKQT